MMATNLKLILLHHALDSHCVVLKALTCSYNFRHRCRLQLPSRD